MNSNDIVLPGEFTKNIDIVFDVIYRPYKTKLLEDAERNGVKVIPGIEMLLGQGAAAFKMWTGIEPPINAMKKSALEALGVKI